MEKSRSLILVILISIIFSLCHSCKKEDKGKPAEWPTVENDRFYFVYYTNPSTDCLDCANTALDALKAQAGEKKDIIVFALHSNANEKFSEYLKARYAKLKIFTIKEPLNIPHPSILLIKNRNVYMFFHISIHPPDLVKSIDDCFELFAAFQNSGG